MRIGLIAALACNSLVGCAEYEARQQAERQQQAFAIAASDDAQCRAYGAQPGTPTYVQCRMNISNQRANVDANDRAIILQHMMRR